MALKKLVTNSFDDDAVTAAKLANAVVSDISDASTAASAAQTSADNALAAIVPTGGIIMWSGTTVPTGWALCDGSNSTPDLRGRFIVGANNVSQAATTTQAGPGFNVDTGVIDSTYTPGDIGGETAHQLTELELAAHTHSEQYNTASSGQDQAGSGSGDNDNTSTQQTGSAGGDDYHENRPPYYALAFIMKT